MASTETPTETPRDFLAVLADDPALVAELTERLHEVITGVRETGKAGAISLSIKVKPYDGNTDILELADDVKHAVPKADRKKKIRYVDTDGALSKSDPNVMDWGTLASVPAHNPATGEIKEARR